MLFIVFLLLAVMLFAGCAVAPTVAPVPVVETATHITSDMRMVHLISVWDDRAYFTYTHFGEGGSIWRNFNNRLAHMQTDGTDVIVFWQAEEREGFEGRRYFINESIRATTGLPGGAIAALIRTDGHWEPEIPWDRFGDDNARAGAQAQHLSTPIMIESRPERYYNILLFNSKGEITAEYDLLALLGLGPGDDVFFPLFDMHALSDGRIILQTEHEFYLFDPAGDGNVETVLSLAERRMWISSSAVTAKDELLAFVVPQAYYLREKQLWRICIESGMTTAVLQEVEDPLAYQILQPGKIHDIYMQVYCMPGGFSHAAGGIVGLDLETGETEILFTWADVGVDDYWSPIFRTCNAGQIYFFRHQWEGDGIWPTTTVLERIDPNDFSDRGMWYCDCLS